MSVPDDADSRGTRGSKGSRGIANRSTRPGHTTERNVLVGNLIETLPGQFRIIGLDIGSTDTGKKGVGENIKQITRAYYDRPGSEVHIRGSVSPSVRTGPRDRDLARRRAESVAAALVQSGIPADRIKVEDAPVFGLDPRAISPVQKATMRGASVEVKAQAQVPHKSADLRGTFREVPLAEAVARGTLDKIASVRMGSGGKIVSDIVTGTVEAVLGGSAAGAPETAQQTRNAPRAQSYAEQALSYALMMLPYEKIFGFGFKGVKRLLKGEAKGAATAAERKFLSELSEAVEQAESAPSKDVAVNLARGNFGERMAADSLAADGHRIISYKPSVLGTNQRGIDIVTFKDGVVYFVDNKALTRSGNVSSVSALTTNFGANKSAVEQSLKQQLTSKSIGPGERQVLADALAAIQSGNYRRVVTNANFVDRATHVLGGVTEKLQKQGIEFMDLMH